MGCPGGLQPLDQAAAVVEQGIEFGAGDEERRQVLEAAEQRDRAGIPLVRLAAQISLPFDNGTTSARDSRYWSVP